MRKVSRPAGSEPPILHKRDAKTGESELDRVARHMDGPDKDKPFPFARYKENTVKAALEKLFHGKCAYCESYYGATQPIDVEHYRPKGEVDGLAGHGGYWWLAMDWSNLLPSCIDCNRRRQQKMPDAKAMSMIDLLAGGDFNRSKSVLAGKSSIFPLADENSRAYRRGDDYEAEKRLLLDPTRDDPRDHLAFQVNRDNLVSLVYPKPLAATGSAEAPEVSAMGRMSIQVYGLNRLGLVQARSKVLRDLEFLLEMLIGLGEIEVEIQDQLDKSVDDEHGFYDRILKRIQGFKNEHLAQLRRMTAPAAPFSELAKAWLKAHVETDPVADDHPPAGR